MENQNIQQSEAQQPQKHGKKGAVAGIVVVVIIAAVAGYAYMHRAPASTFCFDFSHNMAFGDHDVTDPVNQAQVSLGVPYYLPEVPALQKALELQGFKIDPYETTGGGVYQAAFFGPSTKVAVTAFQKRYGLPQTGQVTNDVLDQLWKLYHCDHAASSTAAMASSTSAYSTSTPPARSTSTTTPQKK